MNIRVFVQSPFADDIVVLTFDHEPSEAQIKKAFLAALEQDVDDLHLFDENDHSFDDPDEDNEGELQGKGGHGRRYHAGTCKKIAVKVRYAGVAVERKFSPAATIERVKNWAIKKLKIAEADATELVLQIAGSEVQPARDQHVGCFASDTCSVAFDLVRAYTVNGDASLDNAQAALIAHLAEGPFLSGADKGRWALVKLNWPYLYVDVFAYNGDKYTLRLDCSGYPKQPPTGAFWDTVADRPLPANKWPRAGGRCGQALRPDWEQGTALYIPCDRKSIAGHDQWASLYPSWLWKPSIGITSYLNVVVELIGGADYVGAPA